jgi:hypothetical protein
MKAWLHAEGFGKETAFPYHIVFSRQEAAEMVEHDAHEVMRGAERDHPKYKWEMVKLPNGNLFVVEGTEKK